MEDELVSDANRLPQKLDKDGAMHLRIPAAAIPMAKLDEILKTYHQYVPPPAIIDPATRALVSHALVAVVTQKKWATQVQLELTGPVRGLEAQIRTYFKRPLACLESVELKLRQMIKLFDNEVAQKAEAARRKLQAELDEKARKEREALELEAAELELEGKADIAKVVVRESQEVSAPIVPTLDVKYSDGVSSRKVRKWKVVDEKKIPDDLWLLDEKEINRLCRLGRAAPAGIEFFDENETTVRPGSMV